MKSTIGSLIGIALNLIRVGGRRDIQKVGDILYLWLIHVDIWQKPTHYCKAIILQLKIKPIWNMASSELFTLLPPINTLSTSNGRKVANTKHTTPWWLPTKQTIGWNLANESWTHKWCVSLSDHTCNCRLKMLGSLSLACWSEAFMLVAVVWIWVPEQGADSLLSWGGHGVWVRNSPCFSKWLRFGGCFCHAAWPVWLVVVGQSPSRVWLFTIPWTAAHQASLSLIISRHLPKFMSIESHILGAYSLKLSQVFV